MKKLIVMVGIQGSGKSSHAATIAESVALDGKSVRVHSTDDFPGLYVDGKIDFTKLSTAHGWNFRNAVHSVLAGVDVVIIDNTNTTAIEMAPYMMLAQSYLYDAQIIIMDTPVDIAFARQKHGAPRHVVEAANARIENLSEQLMPWWPVPKIVNGA